MRAEKPGAAGHNSDGLLAGTRGHGADYLNAGIALGEQKPADPPGDQWRIIAAQDVVAPGTTDAAPEFSSACFLGSTVFSRLGLMLRAWLSGKRENMSTEDACCTIVPYFRVADGRLNAFKELCQQFVDKAGVEPKCLYYGFSFCGNEAHCREGYADAEGALAHLENVGQLLDEALKMAELVRLEIHGPEEELAKLREPLAKLNPQFFTLEYGFRR